MPRNLKYNLLMLLAALIWGSAFVAQRAGMDHIGPYAFNCVRSFIGSIALLPVIMLFGKLGAVRQLAAPRGRRDLVVGAVICGTVLTVATLFQQVGLKYTTAGKAGFITAQYILLVPLLGLAIGRKVSWCVWVAVALAIAGMYCLCIKDGFRMEHGDLLVFFCAISFSLHIMVIDHFAKKVDGIMLSCAQFIVCGLISGIIMLCTEKPSLGDLSAGWIPLVYTGILSSGVAYTLQIITQQHLSPAIAALVMSMESVFAALSGWIVLGERLSTKELVGCVLVFVATLLAQVPSKDGR